MTLQTGSTLGEGSKSAGRRLRRAAPLIMACAVLASCAGDGRGKPQAQITFDHLPVMGVNVAAIDLPQGEQVMAQQDFILSPAAAAQAYLAHRFKAYGYNNRLRFTVGRAEVRTGHRKNPNKVASFFDVAGQQVYQLDLTIRAEHLADNGHVIYGKAVSARRVMNIDEHASLAERDAHQTSGLEALFADMDKALTRVIQDEMRLSTPVR